MYSKPSRILIALALLINAGIVVGFLRPDLLSDAQTLLSNLIEQTQERSGSAEANQTDVEPVPTTTLRLRPTTTTTTSSSTTSTSSTSTTTTTTMPLSALEVLVNRAMNDVPTVEGVTEYWVPMLSQKWNGLEYEGVTYGDQEILDLDTYLRAEYGAVVLWTANYTSFFRTDMWVHIIPQAFSTKEGALAWCAASGRSRADCGAKVVSRTRGTKGTTAWLP